MGWEIVIYVILISLFIFLGYAYVRGARMQKEDAYRLLEEPSPNPEEIKEVIKVLNRYVGRWRKDEEIKELIRHLMDRLAKLGERQKD